MRGVRVLCVRPLRLPANGGHGDRLYAGHERGAWVLFFFSRCGGEGEGGIFAELYIGCFVS